MKRTAPQILARSIARLGSGTQEVGGRIAVAVTDTQELWVVDLSVAGGSWTRGASGGVDCTLVVTERALAAFGDPAALQRAIEAKELAVLGDVERLQSLARAIDLGPGWAAETEHAAA
jgi:hypothetical protein